MYRYFLFVLVAPVAALIASPFDHSPLIFDKRPATAKAPSPQQKVSSSSSVQVSVRRSSPSQSLPASNTPSEGGFQLGIERLRADNFSILKNKHVGLLTHAAAIDHNGLTTIEIIRNAPDVKLIALYAPEHGLDGLAKAEEKVDDNRFEGLPVFSLYGDTRKPTPDMLKGIDIFVIDLQDIGVRSYTYISAMKYAMQACFEQNIPVLVLDRPNPLGGLKVDGPILDPKFKSYVGCYQIPYIHGLTIGEIAKIAAEEIKPLSGSLTIVKMSGWHRRMIWSDLKPGLNWRATSPSIPTAGSAFGYACTGLGAQLGGFRHGYGTEYPFRLLSHPKLSAWNLKQRLDRERLPGFAFSVMQRDVAGHWNPAQPPTPPAQRGFSERTVDLLSHIVGNENKNEGVYVTITNWQSTSPCALSLSMLQIAQELEDSGPFVSAGKSTQELFNKHWGRAEPLNTLQSNRKLNAFSLARYWQSQAYLWQAQAKKYWLYN